MLKQLNELDLEPIIVKAIDNEEGFGWSVEYALEVSSEYKKFLFMCMENPDKPIVPSSQIDDFWHLHILDTQKYAEDCEMFLGYFLHHFPYFGMRGDEDLKNLESAWADTKRLYEELYGTKLPQPIWNGKKRCPNCGVRCKDQSNSAFNVRPTLDSILI